MYILLIAVCSITIEPPPPGAGRGAPAGHAFGYPGTSGLFHRAACADLTAHREAGTAEDLLRSVFAGWLKGERGESEMVASLRQEVLRRWPAIQRDAKRLGEIKDIRWTRVDDGVYRFTASHSNGSATWHVRLSRDGLLLAALRHSDVKLAGAGEPASSSAQSR